MRISDWSSDVCSADLCEAYDLISHLLTVGTSLKSRGHRCNVVDRNTGRVGGEFFRATDVIKVYDAEGREIDGSTGIILTGHERSGHYRRQHYGPNSSQIGRAHV